jgi:hypothetical protein
MDEKPTDGQVGSTLLAYAKAEDHGFNVDPLELGKVMVRKLLNAAMTGKHSVNEAMDKQKAGRQLLELAADAVASVERLFSERMFDAKAAGFGSANAAWEIVTLASSATSIVESMCKPNDQSISQHLREVAADKDEFPMMYSGLRRVMARRMQMLKDLKLGSKSPFKEEDGRRRGPGMLNDDMRHLITVTYLEIEHIRSRSGTLFKPNPQLTKRIKHLRPLTLRTYQRWAPVMAEIASTWGGEEPAIYLPGTWLHRLGSPESATKRNWNKRIKEFERSGKPVPKLTPQKPSKADRKKLLAARIRDRLEDILKPLPQSPTAQTNS